MILTNQTIDKLHEYFMSRLGMYNYKNGWLKGDCPYCGKKNKFGVHLGYNRTNCFVCERKTKPIDVVVMVEGFKERTEAWALVRVFEGIRYSTPTLHKPILRPIALPEFYKILSLGNNLIGKAARKYWKGRGFKILESSMKGIGYCDDGPYAYRIIIPYYRNGQLIYFTARQFIDVGSKFKNPPLEDFGLGKSTLIYNCDALNLYQKIYLVESATNALTLGDDAIAIGGKAISNYQLSEIIRSECKEVIIGLDSDAYKQALGIALKLTPFKKVKVLKFPEGEDINDLGKKPTKFIEKEIPFNTYREFYKENLKIKHAT